MLSEKLELAVPGQQAGPAVLSTYILDGVSAAPGRRRPVVVVVPGGGYERCSDREGEPIAMQFLAMGCHACVLKYSVAPNRFPTALRELALAIALIREHAEEWQADPGAVLVCGFSAGGHLACSIGAFWNRAVSYDIIGKTADQVRPDGLILCYPVITSEEYRHQGSFEKLLGENVCRTTSDVTEVNVLMRLVSMEYQVTDKMPPVFLWHTVTDETVPVENSLLLAGALQKAHVNYEMHLYPSGCHGLALATEETAGERDYQLEPCCQTWISLVQSWIGNRFMKK